MKFLYVTGKYAFIYLASILMIACMIVVSGITGFVMDIISYITDVAIPSLNEYYEDYKEELK